MCGIFVVVYVGKIYRGIRIKTIFCDQGLYLPIIILCVWLVFEVLYLMMGREKWLWKLVSWILRPWSFWAALSVVYQLNPSRGMGVLKTAPTYIPNIFPFFAQPWNRNETFLSVMARLSATSTVWVFGSVVVLLAGILFVVIKRVLSDESFSRKQIILMLSGLYLVAGVLSFSVGSLPDGVWSSAEKNGSFLSGWHAHNTVLYAVPFVKSKGHFLRNFKEIQPRLRITIHALSHPPGGALSMYYLGKAVGAQGMNIRLDSTRIRYAFGLVFFAALNVFVLFAMGRSMFGSNKHGFTAAMLWMVMPSVLAYSIFAQDSLYAVFFNLTLLFSWRVCTLEKMPYVDMVVLGVVFFFLNFLNYSWCLVTLIFALFLLYCWRSFKWTFRSLFLRGVIPLGIMTVLSGIVLLKYKLNYLDAYKVSSEYVRQWYQFETVYQNVVAWIGGQVDLFLMMGAVTCSAFFASVYAGIRKRKLSLQLTFLLIILSVYLLPIIFGPTCIRLETARCWMWVLSVPVCFAAQFLLKQDRARIFVTVAVMVSLATYTVMRLFLNFAP